MKEINMGEKIKQNKRDFPGPCDKNAVDSV